MTPQSKLQAIEKLLPDRTSTIFNDVSYCNLVNDIKNIIKGNIINEKKKKIPKKTKL